MSTAIALKPVDWTPEQMKLITDTVARGASSDELKLFLYRCRNMGLDPLKPGQIHFVKYSTGPGTIVVGIEGFRSISQRTGKKSGVKRGVIKDEKGKLTGAWCEVYRSDWKECAREEVPLAEYDTGRGPWKNMPETMIKKVAECAALRMAFPDDLGGIYEPAEMDQAERSPVNPGTPGPEDGVEMPESWKFPVGKYKGRTVEEVYNSPTFGWGPDGLKSWIKYLEDNSVKTGKPLSAVAEESIKHVEDFIGMMENAPEEAGA